MAHVKIYSTLVCPYCVRAKQLLTQRGVRELEEVRVDLNPAERVAMMELTGRRTVPQIFIDGRHIDDCDDLIHLDQRGALEPLLRSASS